MNLRGMTLDDYEAVYSLWRCTPGMGLNMADDSKVGIARYLDRNPNTCFVMEENGEIIGAILSGHDGRRGFISHTAVAAHVQRQGVGTALVKAALHALAAAGITKVALVVFNKNQRGNAFWQAQGFTVREDLTYRNRALIEMQRIDT